MVFTLEESEAILKRYTPFTSRREDIEKGLIPEHLWMVSTEEGFYELKAEANKAGKYLAIRVRMHKGTPVYVLPLRPSPGSYNLPHLLVLHDSVRALDHKFVERLGKHMTGSITLWPMQNLDRIMEAELNAREETRILK